MVGSVRVNEDVDKTVVMGFQVKKVAQAIGIPVGVTVLYYIFDGILYDHPLWATGGLVIISVFLGLLLYYSTPDGMYPAEFLFGKINRYLRPSKSVNKANEVQDGDFILDGGEVQVSSGQSSGLLPFGQSGDTLDEVPIEAIHDDGVIETEQMFTKILHVGPTQWHNIAPAERESVVTILSQLHNSAGFPIRWITYQTRYDMDHYFDALDDAVESDVEENDVLAYGRKYHRHDMKQFVGGGEDTTESISDRRFAVAVGAHKDSDEELYEVGFMSSILSSIPISLTALEPEIDEEGGRVTTLEHRARTVRRTLSKGNWSVEVIDNRDEVLALFNMYYQNGDGELSWKPAPMTTLGGDLTVDGNGGLDVGEVEGGETGRSADPNVSATPFTGGAQS